VGYIFGGVLSFVLIIVLSFYLAVQEAGIENFLRIITPNRHETYVMSLWKRTQIKIGLYMQGQLLLGLIIGILVFLGLTILGIKQALLLACLAAVFELIPIFGPILSAIPAILIGATSGGLSMGLIIAGLYTIIQQFENHLIYPLVVKKIVGVSPIIVILALIVGFKLAGFLGILLSVPISTAIMEYLNDLQKGRVTEDKAILTQ
jgi:predicted PurR-regulated permease PerM